MKIKEGFCDIWLPTFLFINREDFALYYQGQYIPEITTDTIDLINKSIKDFSVKSYNVSGRKLELLNRYRELTQQDPVLKANNKSLIETIKPLLILAKTLKEQDNKKKT